MKTTNLTTIKLSKTKPSTAQYCPLMTQYHRVPSLRFEVIAAQSKVIGQKLAVLQKISGVAN